MRKLCRGMAVTLAALAFTASAYAAPVETVLYTFTGMPDGAVPQSALIADATGALYGTTAVGGTNSYGTIFKLTPPAKGKSVWTDTVLYNYPVRGGGDYHVIATLLARSTGTRCL